MERKMTKAVEMAKVSAKGGFHLLWGLVASTVISAIGTIIIARLLGSDNLGLYTIALTGPNLIATFRDWGINTAIVKYSAQYNSENNQIKIRNVFVAALLFEIILGLSLSLLTFFLSGFLADNFKRPIIVPLIQIASFIILSGALINTATAAFTGLEKMHLNSIMLIIQSIIKSTVMVGLVALGLGTLGIVTGSTFAVLIAGIAGVLLMWTMYKSISKTTSGKLELLSTTKIMFKYGLPLSIGNILTGLVGQFYNILMAIFVTDNSIIGNYTVAANFIVLITFFATPVTTMLFPAFSKLDYKKDHEALKNVFQYSVKYASIIVVPVSAMVIALSQPAIATIYGSSYSIAPLFLALLSSSYLFAALGNLSVGNLLNGQGYTMYNLKLTVVTSGIGVPVGLVLIPQFGVIGLIITSLIVGLPSLFISLGYVKKHFGVSVDWASSAKILFSSGIAAVAIYILISTLRFSDLVNLIIGVFSFLIVFVLVALATRTINRTDLQNMRQIVHALGPLRRPLGFLLNLIEKLMNLFQPK
jgi:O-antigen/teichoic acid export membrane protein